MTDNTTTQLHRNDTFPYDGKDYNDINNHAIETSDGWFSVVVEPGTNEFVLTTPLGKQIEDCLTEVHKRKDMYDLYQENIYDWLQMVRDKIAKLRSLEGEDSVWFKVGDRKYMMQVNNKTGEVKLTMPLQTRIFSAEDMYFAGNEDLPLIQDGRLDDIIRRRLINKGFDLPKVPYKIAYEVKQKNQSK